MSPLEIAAVLTSVLGIWLSTRRKLSSWPVILVSCVLYALVFRREKLYSDMLLQFAYFAFGVYGWWHWWGGVKEEGIVRVERLKTMGHELRRPEADVLRDGIHELRARMGTINYRVLYFFHGQTAVLSHGLTKEREVPDREIGLAIARKELFEANPLRHTLKENGHGPTEADHGRG